MEQTAGISIERTYPGKTQYIKFDYDKYGSLLQAFFLEQGIQLPHIPNETTKAAIKEAATNKTTGFDTIDALLADLKH